MEFRCLRPTQEELDNSEFEENLEILMESHREDQNRMKAEGEIVREKDVDPSYEGYEPIKQDEMNAIWETVLNKIP